jgi:ABC-type lipoprotein release transport system permease subunit
MLAMVAVVLCSAMVLTVWSVMGGFLQMLLDSGRVQIGDVILTRPVLGLPLYKELIESLEADPGIEAATGIIETPALLKYPYGITRGSRDTRTRSGGGHWRTRFLRTPRARIGVCASTRPTSVPVSR